MAVPILEKVGLKNQLFKYPSQISGGQQRRVGLARILTLRPEVVAGLALEAPAPVDAAALCTIHDAAYVEAVRTGAPAGLAGSNGFETNPTAPASRSG